MRDAINSSLSAQKRDPGTVASFARREDSEQKVGTVKLSHCGLVYGECGKKIVSFVLIMPGRLDLLHRNTYALTGCNLSLLMTFCTSKGYSIILTFILNPENNVTWAE